MEKSNRKYLPYLLFFCLLAGIASSLASETRAEDVEETAMSFVLYNDGGELMDRLHAVGCDTLYEALVYIRNNLAGGASADLVDRLDGLITALNGRPSDSAVFAASPSDFAGTSDAVCVNEDGTFSLCDLDVYDYLGETSFKTRRGNVRVSCASSEYDYVYLGSNAQDYGGGVTKTTKYYAFAMALRDGLPEIETGEILDLTATDALVLGNSTGDGGGTIAERGVVYSTSPGPTVETGTVVAAATAETGEFDVSISGLSPNTKYYACAYSENEQGVSYGGDRSFTTPVSVRTVPVGAMPQAIALNRTTNKIYVPNFVGNTVSVIDGDSDAVIATVAVGKAPYSVAVNETTNRIYVPNNTDNTVSVINGGTDSVEATVAAGNAARAAAVNATTNKIYVTNYTAASVSVIDGATNTVTTTVTVGSRPIAVAVNETTNKIYVANYWGDSVSVIDGTDDTVDETVTVGSDPRHLAVNETTNKVYVVDYRGPSVTVIDGEDNGAETVALEAGAFPWAAAANESTNKIYVTNSGTNSVTIIDGDDNSTTIIAAGESPQSVAVNETTNMVYVGNYNADDRSNVGYIVTKIDGDTNEIVGFSDTSNPSELVVNETTNKTYVVNNVGNSVVIIEEYEANYACEIVGGIQYGTLDDALSAVLDGQTIRLLRDIDYNGGIAIEGMGIVFDLNGFDLNVESASEIGLEVRNGGMLALTGNGSLNVVVSSGGD